MAAPINELQNGLLILQASYDRLSRSYYQGYYQGHYQGHQQPHSPSLQAYYYFLYTLQGGQLPAPMSHPIPLPPPPYTAAAEAPSRAAQLKLHATAAQRRLVESAITQMRQEMASELSGIEKRLGIKMEAAQAQRTKMKAIKARVTKMEAAVVERKARGREEAGQVLMIVVIVLVVVPPLIMYYGCSF